jgi:hypothetical protein
MTPINMAYLWTRNLAYDVVVDDQVVGTVRAKDPFSFSVSPGHHRIHVKYDPENERSNEVEVSVETTQTADFICWTRPGMATRNPLLIGRMFRLKLRAIEASNRTAKNH